ncbi:MAG: CsgG/HfaB family protein [Holosporaceae bacterium]|jgi:TolB-like protein|nr:CsgG/HfaB family protein [Holosporaceae bacterium]
MRKGLILLIAIFVCSLVSAQDRIAVLPTSGNADEGVRGMLTEALSDGILNSKQYKLVERAQLGKIMEELNMQVGDFFDDSKATEIGKFSGAKYICLSSCNKSGYNYMISYRLVDVETGDVLFRERKTTTESSLMESINAIASEKLFAQSSSSNELFFCDVEIMKTDFKGSERNLPAGWRLPTISELRCMCEHKNEIGGFNGGEYISSEFKNSIRQGIRFNSCTQTTIIDQASIRCVKKQ